MTLALHGFNDWQDPLHTADLQTAVQTLSIVTGATSQTAIFDMRPYSSFGINLTAVSHTPPQTNWNGIAYSVEWYSDAAGSQPIYEDSGKFLVQDSGGAFVTRFGTVEINDAVHGPYMQVTIVNQGPDTNDVSYRIFGNSRSMGRRYLINKPNGINPTVTGIEGILPPIGGFVAPGATFTNAQPMLPGQCTLSVQTGNSAFTVLLTDPTGVGFWQTNIPANANNNYFLPLPRSAFLVKLTNTGAANVFIGVQGVVDQNGWV